MWLCTILCVGWIFTMDRIITYTWRYTHAKWKMSKRHKKRRRPVSTPVEGNNYNELPDDRE